jgi:hypothetical protein
MADQPERDDPRYDSVDSVESNEEGPLLGGLSPFTRETEGVVAGPPSGQAGGVVANELVDTDGGIGRPTNDSADFPGGFAGSGATDVEDDTPDDPNKGTW